MPPRPTTPAKTLPTDFLAKADETVAHYPFSARSATLPLLHLWQEQFGFISEEAIVWIAARLGQVPIHVLEVATFYPMFHREPFGKIHIKVCRTLSCELAGGRELFETMKRLTGATGDEHGPIHSPDGRYTLEFVECLASCGTAPVCMVDETLHEKLDTPEKIKACLDTHSTGGEPCPIT